MRINMGDKNNKEVENAATEKAPELAIGILEQDDGVAIEFSNPVDFALMSFEDAINLGRHLVKAGKRGLNRNGPRIITR